MRTLNAIVLTLVIVGALNWGLVGAFGFNLVGAIFGEASTASAIVYILVGLAGLYSLSFYPLVMRLWDEYAEPVTSRRPVGTV